MNERPEIIQHRTPALDNLQAQLPFGGIIGIANYYNIR